MTVKRKTATCQTRKERKIKQSCFHSSTGRKLEKILRTLLDEDEFLAPGGIRGLSKYHLNKPRHYEFGGKNFDISYDPAESTTDMFGGNSNWRGRFGCLSIILSSKP
jgi:hypothetical protein